VLGAACTSHQHHPYDPRTAHQPGPPSDREPIAALRLESGVPEIDNHTLDYPGSRKHKLHELEFDSVGENGQPGDEVAAHWYRSQTSEPQPAVFLLPIWGSYTYPQEQLGAGLMARHGEDVHVIQVLGRRDLFDWEAMKNAPDEDAFMEIARRMVQRYKNTLLDLRRFVRWAAARPEIDGDRIALVGFSMSAVAASSVLVAEPEVDAGVLIMGGAHPGMLVAECPGDLGKVRATVKANIGWDQQRYRELFVELFGHFDPARYPGRVDPGSVLIIDAAHDKCMTEQARDALWEAMGRPERITYDYSHKTAFLAMTPLGLNHMRRQIFEFLDPLLHDDESF